MTYEKQPHDRRLLLVASTGGHLAQLARLAPSLGASDESLWVTFKTPQSESLLRGKNVLYLPYVASRDLLGAGRAARQISEALSRDSEFDAAVSTGAALAVAALPVARRHGIEATYIESVSRVDGPSLSGRILAKFPSIATFTQHESWAGKRWRPHPSVLKRFEVTTREPARKPRLFVTLGTIKKYRFDSLVDAVLECGLADESTVWQLGESYGRTDLPGQVFRQVSADQFDEFARSADVVVSHAGVGSLLGLMELGIYPVLSARRKERSEHVDNHQSQIARTVNELGIGLAVDAADLNRSHLMVAAARSIRPVD